MGRFFKIFLNLSQRNLLKNLVILFKIWRKIGPIGILNGSLFLEKLVFVCVCCQIPLRHIPTKTKLECPLGLQISFELIEETYMFFTTNPSFVESTIVSCPRCWSVQWSSLKKRKKKKVCLRMVSRYQRGNLLWLNEDVTFPRWPPWEFCMA